MTSELTILPGLRKGTVTIPPSKSHLHRLMIAEFLARNCTYVPGDCVLAEDILATRACLDALRRDTVPMLPCQESGSTLRFMLPVAMACRNEAFFTAEGRLPQRPIAPFLELLAHHGVQCLSPAEALFPLHLQGRLQPGEYILPGNISSQIVTGLLFALPMLPGDSVIRLTTPMESSGYVEMTLQVLRAFQIEVTATEDNTFLIPGKQHYLATPGTLATAPELDWSGAAFWLAMNRLGSHITLPSMPENSRQPDRQITALLTKLGRAPIDVSQCPDIFPVLSVAAAAIPATTLFTGVKRLRLKESDRLTAMAELLNNFGVTTSNAENSFAVQGIGPNFPGNVTIDPHNDHRIAMAAAVAATIAKGPVTILTPDCVRKSYPDFFQQFQALDIR